MSSAISKALDRSNSIYSTAHSFALMDKRSGRFALQQSPFDIPNYVDTRLSGVSENRYTLYRGWIYAVINALASEGASQAIQVGRIAGESGNEGKPKKLKDWQRRRMTDSARTKAADRELEVLMDHPLADVLEWPNPIQHRYQFTYSFIANLALTGWGFVAVDENEEGRLEFYSIPSTWIRPDNSKGVFQQFHIVNPRNPNADLGEPLTRDQITFAYLPNPGNPLASLSPATAQKAAIAIDDHIQESQRNFFKNGMFPSVLITMGKNPHPDVPGGLRPRLTNAQRREIIGAIQKTSVGVERHGNPAIIDGLIENIERFSSTQNEMGWEKSEKTVRSRILAGFGIHPFILGEEMAGSYAQAYIVEKRFASKVNTYLDMASTMMTKFVRPLIDDDKIMVWWEKAVANDPSLEKALWEGARSRDDITQNEFRAFMDLPPDEDGNEAHIPKQIAQQVINLIEKVKAGKILVDSGIATLESFGIPTDKAKRMIGNPPPPPSENIIDNPIERTSEEEDQQGDDKTKPIRVPRPPKPTGEGHPEEDDDAKVLGEILDRAIVELKMPIESSVDEILKFSNMKDKISTSDSNDDENK